MAREYRDSGIEWIGQIPKQWEVNKINRLFSTIGSGTTPTSTDNDAYIGHINWIQSGDLNGSVLEVVKNRISEDTLSKYSALTVYNAPFIIIAMYGASVGNISISTIDGCCNQACCVLCKSNINFKYAFYAIKSSQRYLVYKAVGGGQPNISQNTLKQLWIPVPNLPAQQKITDFLDKVCGEVDEMVTLQETMIEELKAYKQSVITEAVTKGLNPNVPMCDSGIDWIGEIPEHWETGKTLYVLSMPITDGPHTTPDLFDDGVPFISADAVSDGYINFDNKRGFVSKEFYDECCKKYIPQLYDVYMIKSGASTGRTAIVETQEIFTIWSPLAVFRANPEVMTPYYLLYMLRSDGYQKQVETFWSYGTQQNIGMRTLEKLIVCIPPLDEQRAIASYLDTKCSEIDSLIALKQAKIEELKEYKKSVIYEYVTGKKEVV